MGNIVNRVFESAGPDGKVRGTPQQIIDKYQALARDAQVSGDRVAAESYLQYSEHYSRMLVEAQRQQAENQSRFNPERDDNNSQPQQRDDNNGQPQQRGDDRDGGRQGDQQQRNDGGHDGDQPRRQNPPSTPSGLTTIEPEDSFDRSGPIDTPEGHRAPRHDPPAERSVRLASSPAAQPAVNGGDSAEGAAAEAAPAKPKRSRTRRKAETEATSADQDTAQAS